MIKFIVIIFAIFITRAVLKELKWKRNWKKSDIYNLPNSPGVYLLYNRWGTLIHVGSSGNLRNRLLNHEKRHKMRRFDWHKTYSKRRAYSTEMKLQKKFGYDGR